LSLTGKIIDVSQFEHQNDKYRWKNGKTTISAERFAGKITKSSVIFRDEVNFGEFEKRSKDLGKKRAKDM